MQGDGELFVDIFEFYFVHNLLHHEMERCLSQSASYLGLSVLELQVLWIASSSMATIAEIARITNQTKERLEKITTGLEQDNLVQRVCSRDSLYTVLQISDQGKRVINQLYSRPNKCRCPLCSEQQTLQELIAEARDLVVKLRGKVSCDLIADLTRRAK